MELLLGPPLVTRKRMSLQDDALTLLQDATTMAKYTPEILYSLAWQSAMQRKLNTVRGNVLNRCQEVQLVHVSC